jgi:hypothetical protein
MLWYAILSVVHRQVFRCLFLSSFFVSSLSLVYFYFYLNLFLLFQFVLFCSSLFLCSFLHLCFLLCHLFLPFSLLLFLLCFFFIFSSIHYLYIFLLSATFPQCLFLPVLTVSLPPLLFPFSLIIPIFLTVIFAPIRRGGRENYVTSSLLTDCECHRHDVKVRGYGVLGKSLLSTAGSSKRHAALTPHPPVQYHLPEILSRGLSNGSDQN